MMDKQEILNQLNGIFTIALKKKVELTEATVANDVDGWDSFTHMTIIDSIEKHFKVKFKLMEVMNFKNVGDTVECLIKKGV